MLLPPPSVIPTILSICKDLVYLEIINFGVMMENNFGASMEAVWNKFRSHSSPRPLHIALYLEEGDEDPGPTPPPDLLSLAIYSRVTHMSTELGDISTWVKTSSFPQTLTHLAVSVFAWRDDDYTGMVTTLTQNIPSSLKACLFVISISDDEELEDQFENVESIWHWIRSDKGQRGAFQLCSHLGRPTAGYESYIEPSLSEFRVHGKYGEMMTSPAQSPLEGPNMWTEVDEALSRSGKVLRCDGSSSGAK